MPELPEVETVRRELGPWLSGKRILRVQRHDAPAGPKYLGLERAQSQQILSVNRRGKFLILPLDDGDELIIHLGMTGIITAELPQRHLRISLSLDDGSVLYFQDTRRFGRFLCVRAGDYRSLPTLQAIGPEPLGEAFTVQEFSEILTRSSMPIKTYLLSQKPVAGVGNIYADEALWLSCIHPLTPARAVPRARATELVAAIKKVLADSIAAQGTTLNDYRTVNGEVGAYITELKVYGHAEDACPRCGNVIHKIVVGGRGTHFCPNCQKV